MHAPSGASRRAFGAKEWMRPMQQRKNSQARNLGFLVVERKKGGIGRGSVASVRETDPRERELKETFRTGGWRRGV